MTLAVELVLLGSEPMTFIVINLVNKLAYWLQLPLDSQ